MSTCPYCGSQNPDAATMCMQCGRQLSMQQPAYQPYQPQPVQQPYQQQYQQQMAQPAHSVVKPKNNMMMIIAVIAVIAVVGVVILAAVLLAGSNPVKIEDWDQTNSYLAVIFTVTVKNYGSTVEVANIQCTAVINGHTYTATYDVTLSPQESKVVNVPVAITAFGDWGQLVQSANCVLL